MPSKVVALYRALLINANLIPHYNFKSYALRRIKHDFKKNRVVQDPTLISSLYQSGLQQLDMLKRQRIIGQLYPEEQSVLEVKHNMR